MIKFMWKDDIKGKPMRQPDAVINMDPYWFDEMVAIVDVHTGPWSKGRQLVDITMLNGVLALIPRKDKCLYPDVPEFLEREFEAWKKRKAEEILLGIKT